MSEAAESAALAAAFSLKRHTLSNGMKILIQEDHTIPSVALFLFFRVGSRNERTGITGLSHFLEHMMFNGARKYGPRRFDQILEAAGGRNNAYTSHNVTVYQDWFPPEALELVLDLESDRMAHLALEQEMFESERGVVASERRMSVENDSLGMLEEQLWAAAYTAHPYQWPIIGWMSDIEQWRHDDLRDYFQTYYAPNNATMVLTGDVSPQHVVALGERYFQSLPAQAAPRGVTTIEPPQLGERRVELRKPAQLPALMLGYHIPAAAHPDFAPLQVLRVLLLQGQSSRLYRRLVDEEQLAIAVGGGFELSFDPTLFHITVQMKGGQETDRAEKTLFAEIARLAGGDVSEEELAKARNILLAGYYRSMKTLGSRTNVLGNFELFFGDCQVAFEMPGRYARVTAAEVSRVVREHFGSRNRTVATLVPEN